MDDQTERTPAGAPAADSGEASSHELIEFVGILADGSEEVRQGFVWSQAPSVRGMKCFWVLPLTDGGWMVRPHAVAVVRASRRHRVGIVARTRTGRTRWIRGGGRFVDIGTYYTEDHDRSDTGSLTQYGAVPPTPPTVIMVPPLDPATFAALSGDTPPEALLQ